ncbi:hypothetical protein PPL_05125 [Heterostelium album PN500]|uniref:Uncharacterized protein n=1 Tax=Heterostelium pallidum (strain ATCC 26659 / Pp 5 / PN500) TaxID=670386 RepID=D3B9I1_HETP5|nr:hypothetical protein PPL_05125 [Heterostelium album PN500]EFA81893.1 hypothetical protein PPL_05125 [Heterostelium album PN500]|eukprot:XP_020434010.1 hypothetical protein PPL_05125 [Heterostelium album PN500]
MVGPNCGVVLSKEPSSGTISYLLQIKSHIDNQYCLLKSIASIYSYRLPDRNLFTGDQLDEHDHKVESHDNGNIDSNSCSSEKDQFNRWIFINLKSLKVDLVNRLDPLTIRKSIRYLQNQLNSSSVTDECQLESLSIGMFDSNQWNTFIDAELFSISLRFLLKGMPRNLTRGLTRLEVYGSNFVNAQTKSLPKFIANHHNLQTLEIHFNMFVEFHNQLIQSIPNSLRSLTIVARPIQVNRLENQKLQLESLRRLKNLEYINCNGYDSSLVADFLFDMPTIRVWKRPIYIQQNVMDKLNATTSNTTDSTSSQTSMLSELNLSIDNTALLNLKPLVLMIPKQVNILTLNINYYADVLNPIVSSGQFDLLTILKVFGDSSQSRFLQFINHPNLINLKDFRCYLGNQTDSIESITNILKSI